MQICWLENLAFVLMWVMMSRCAYLNHTVLTCTVHNSGMILLKPLWKILSVGYNNRLRRQMDKLDKHCSASGMFVRLMAYLPLVNYKGNISQSLSIGFSPVKIVLLWVLFYLLFRCLRLSEATGLILYTLANDILWSDIITFVFVVFKPCWWLGSF